MGTSGFTITDLDDLPTCDKHTHRHM